MPSDPSPVVERLWLARAQTDGTFDLDHTIQDYADVKCLYRMRLFRVARIALRYFWHLEPELPEADRQKELDLWEEVEGYLELAQKGLTDREQYELSEGLG